MRYNQIRECDIANGEGIGVALFVQGCNFHCKGCFNSETWDFNGGKEWTSKIEDKFIELAKRPYIKRISILGGEPLTNENLDDVLKLVNKIRLLMPEKTIWLYSGYTFESIMNLNDEISLKRQEILKLCDVLVDGRFVEELKDLTLAYRGSKNQRVINIPKTLEQKEIVLYCD